MTMSVPVANRPLVAKWLSQLVGTLVLAGVAWAYLRSLGSPFANVDPDWVKYATWAIVFSVFPAIGYLRTFKAWLDEDARLLREQQGVPHPECRRGLSRAQSIGGVLCELPLAFGVAHALLTAETRWFLGATLVTIALRLSYRPFEKLG
jgi:hypothetical protein